MSDGKTGRKEIVICAFSAQFSSITATPSGLAVPPRCSASLFRVRVLASFASPPLGGASHYGVVLSHLYEGIISDSSTWRCHSVRSYECHGGASHSGLIPITSSSRHMAFRPHSVHIPMETPRIPAPFPSHPHGGADYTATGLLFFCSFPVRYFCRFIVDTFQLLLVLLSFCLNAIDCLVLSLDFDVHIVG